MDHIFYWRFWSFAKDYGYIYTYSSPKYPQVIMNGEAVWESNEDHESLLKKVLTLWLIAYCTTLLRTDTVQQSWWWDISFVQWLSQFANYSQLCQKERQMRDRSKKNFDTHHCARTLELLIYTRRKHVVARQSFYWKSDWRERAPHGSVIDFRWRVSEEPKSNYFNMQWRTWSFNSHDSKSKWFKYHPNTKWVCT